MRAPGTKGTIGLTAIGPSFVHFWRAELKERSGRTYQRPDRKLLSDEHFTVDGTLIEAWAGHKSSQPKQDNHDNLKPPPAKDHSNNPTVNWRKEKRSNETHQSLTDPYARLFKKARGAEAQLACLGHVVTENRHGLVVDVRLTQATGTAEREDAVDMMSHKPAGKRVSLGGDKGYDTADFVQQLREMKVTPHVAQNNSHRRSAIDARTTRYEGYAISQRKRKRVEEVFGWMKTVALQRKTRFVGPEKTGWMFTLAAAAYNLVRMRNPLGVCSGRARTTLLPPQNLAHWSFLLCHWPWLVIRRGGSSLVI